MTVFVRQVAIRSLHGMAVKLEAAATMALVLLLVQHRQNLVILVILLEHHAIFLLVVEQTSDVAMAHVHLASVMPAVKRLGIVTTQNHFGE